MGKYVEELKPCAPNAMKEIKELTKVVAQNNHSKNYEHVQTVFERTVHSEEALFGIQAFLQKTTPNWAEFLKSKL